MASLEVGKRNRNMHIQGVFECRYPAKEHKALCKLIEIIITYYLKNNYLFTIGKFIKTNYIPGGGVGFKVMLKVCPRGQTFTAMIGYCTKDRNNSYFQMVSKGVSLTVSISC